MANIEELIGFAADKNPTEFQRVFEEIISSKTFKAIDEKRIDIAQNLYKEDEDGDEDFEELDLEDVDIDDLIDDEDLEDDEDNA